MNRSTSEQALPSPPPSRGRVSPPIKAAAPAFPSAEEEKAALKRYHEAKIAVDRTQGIQAPKSPPLPYDTLYPNDLSRSNSHSMPPSFGSSNSYPSNALAEKEKLRRAYEAQDAAALNQQQTPAYDSPPEPYSSPDYTAPPPAAGRSSPLTEKELLRRRYEAQDAAALANAYPSPQPPPRRPSVQVPATAPIAGGSSILSAVEEKARLKAQYEAQDRQSLAPNGSSSPPPSFGHPFIRHTTPPPPPPPPPLMPRPPAEYIQETQEVDARIRDSVAGQDLTLLPHENGIQELDLSPFTPFTAGISEPPGPPPPLPPKQFPN